MTALEHIQAVYQKFSLFTTLFMVPRTTKTESYNKTTITITFKLKNYDFKLTMENND